MSDAIKKPLYWMVEQDSRAASELGRALNWDYLTEEGKRNQKNPGRAIGKAAAMAASMYLGGLDAGAGAAGAAGAAEVGAAMTAEELAKIAAAEALDTGLMTAGDAVISQAPGMIPQGASSMAPQGFMNTMEAGLTDTGYTPSTLWNALTKGPGSGQTMGESVGKWASNQGNTLMTTAKNNPMGLLTGGGGKGSEQMMMKMGAGLLEPQQQGPQAPPMRPSSGQVEPLNNPYGRGGNSLGIDNMTEAEKRRLRALGYQV